MRCRWRSAITRRAVAAAKAWLESLCGDYAPLRRQFVEAYLRCVAAQIETHRAELAARLRAIRRAVCARRLSVVCAASAAARLGTGRRSVAARRHGVLGWRAADRHRTGRARHGSTARAAGGRRHGLPHRAQHVRSARCGIARCLLAASGKVRRCRPARSAARYHSGCSPNLSLRAQRSNLHQKCSTTSMEIALPRRFSRRQGSGVISRRRASRYPSCQTAGSSTARSRRHPACRTPRHHSVRRYTPASDRSDADRPT